MKYIKTFENYKNENLDLIEESWKQWVAAGLITLSSMAGVYKINKDREEKDKQGTELVNMTSKILKNMSTEDKSALILNLSNKHSKEVDANAALNTAEMGYDDSGSKLTTNPDAINRSKKQKKMDDEIYNDQLNKTIENLMKKHPDFFKIDTREDKNGEIKAI